MSRVGPVLISLLFSPLVPSSYQVLCGSMYSFALETNRDHSAIQVYAPTSNAEEAEVERFYEDL